jgi:hypothetical protein
MHVLRRHASRTSTSLTFPTVTSVQILQVLTPTWTKSARGNASFNIYETDVPAALTEIRGLTTLDPHRRVTRAREPNADPTEGAELCTVLVFRTELCT